MQGYFESFNRFLDQPFSEDMDAVSWFAFIGLLIVILVVWQTIIGKLTD